VGGAKNPGSICHVRWCGIVLILIALYGSPAGLGRNDDVFPFNVDEWLRGPDRQDFPWDVKAYKPALTLQQRFLVQLHASIDVNKLPDRELWHDFHILVKVADAEKQWVPDGFHAQIAVPPSTGELAPLTFDGGLYLRPGRYTVAIIAYDATLKQGNISRHELRVSAPRRDPLPELDRDLPKVEFIRGLPAHALMDSVDSVSVVRADWPLGVGKEWLPVKNRRDLCIDIIVNISANQKSARDDLRPWDRQRPWWEYNYRINSSQVMQVASVLSHLRPRAGSVRVTILDVLRVKTIFDREDASNLDWQHVSEVVENQDQTMVDKSLLNSRNQAPAFLLSSVQKILDDRKCRRREDSPPKIVILISSELIFDDDSKREQIVPQDPGSARFIYFFVTTRTYVNDDIFKMLKQNKPTCFFLLDPLYFRKEIASLIASLEKH
jgi:hypothetical protein